MRNKIKEKGTLTLYGLYIFFGVCFLLYIPIKCTTEIIDRIQNPPSEIYAENQILDKWKSFCLKGQSEDDCEVYGLRLKTKSDLGPMKSVPISVLSENKDDENFDELSISLKDWRTGEIIYPYPQEKEKWYEFNKQYDSFETTGTLIDEDGNDIISYEVTLMRDKIIISKESCDSRGLEEKSNKIKGGCYFLEEYEKNKNELFTLEIMLKDNKKALISL